MYHLDMTIEGLRPPARTVEDAAARLEGKFPGEPRIVLEPVVGGGYRPVYNGPPRLEERFMDAVDGEMVPQQSQIINSDLGGW